MNNTGETDPFVLSNSFNKVFVTNAKKIESNMAHTPKNYTDYLKNPSEKTFFLSPTIGPSSIPTKLLKEYSKTLSIPISKLINQSFITGIFPESLKLAVVILICKKSRSSGMHRLLTHITNLKYQQNFRKISP